MGAFYQPKLVIADTDCLKTLTDRIVCDGMAEVIKYGMIADAALFEKLEQMRGVQDLSAHWEEIICTCCDIKRAVVSEDERYVYKRQA